MEKLSKKVQAKIDSGREYRAFVSDMEITDEQEMIVEGYATTFNQPYLLGSWDGYNIFEQVDRNAFAETDMTDVIMQYDHQGRVFARNKNGTLELTVDARGLKVRANLGGTEIGRQLYQEIKGGYTDKMSFGFTVADDEFVADDNGELRTITKVGKLYDVSAVSIPANDATSISARKFCEGVVAELETERERAAEKRKKDILRLKIKIQENLTNEY